MEHPITPPDVLVQQWRHRWTEGHGEFGVYLATQAARWGDDQRLEACCDFVDDAGYPALAARMRSAFRPKPPSIAVQALQKLEDAVMRGDCITTTDAMPTLRKALARLFELEALSDD